MSHGKGETTAEKGGRRGETETEGGKERKGEKDGEDAHRENEVPAMVTGGWRKGAVGAGKGGGGRGRWRRTRQLITGDWQTEN